MMNRRPNIYMMAIIGACMIAGQAKAVPNFSRVTGLSCNQCHSSFPTLNSFGREYQRNGYVRKGEVEDAIELSESLTLSKYPISGLVKLRPYDNKKSNDSAEMRSFHELELFIAGTVGNVVGKNISYWTEFEAEDETDFSLDMQAFELGYHLMPEFTIFIGNRSLAEADPLQTLSNHARPTINKRGIFNKGFGSGETTSAKQNVGVGGIFCDSIIYGARYGADVNDAEGTQIEDGSDVELRLAYLLPFAKHAVSVGGYYKTGSQKMGNGDETALDFVDFDRLDFDRYVADVMFDGKCGRYVFAYQIAKDDTSPTMDESNNGFFIEGSYPFLRDSKPFIVPLVRYDDYERTDGSETYRQLTCNLSCFLRENARAYIEYWQELDTPDTSKNDRISLQVEVGI